MRAVAPHNSVLPASVCTCRRQFSWQRRAATCLCEPLVARPRCPGRLLHGRSVAPPLGQAGQRLFLGTFWGEAVETRKPGSVGSASVEVLETCNGGVLENKERDTLTGSVLWISEDNSDQKTKQAVEILQEAVCTRKVPAQQVEAAMLFLEQQHLSSNSKKDFLSFLEGSWRLVMSTVIPFFNYIPVSEVATLQPTEGTANLFTNWAFLKFQIPGTFKWSQADQTMTFKFNELRPQIFGRELNPVPLNAPEKTYSFFYVDDRIACTRSSGKGVTLLSRVYFSSRVALCEYNQKTRNP